MSSAFNSFRIFPDCLSSSSAPGPFVAAKIPPSFTKGIPHSAMTGSIFTALAVTISKVSLVFLRRPPSSARIWRIFIFLIPSFAAAFSINTSFFKTESTSTTCISGRRMASGIPGNPAPVPKSSIRPFFGKYFSSYTVSES